MGDEAEYLFQHGIDQMVYDDMVAMGLIEEEVNHDVWTMRDGTKIRFGKMTLTHIQNSMCMLERNGRTHIWQYNRLKQELNTRNKKPPEHKSNQGCYW